MPVLTGRHSILQVHPSRTCNLSCIHCYSESGPHVREALPIELLTTAVQDAAELGYTVLSVSGGEPTLYPHLVDLLHGARAAGMRTTITSNGAPLTDRLIDQLAGLVDVLALSLDGRPETHNRMRNHPKAFDALDRRMPAIAASGIPLGFITTLTQHNVHELEWVVDYARTQGASLVQVHPLELVGAATALSGSAPDLLEEAFALLEAARLASEASAAGDDVAIQVDISSRIDLEVHPGAFDLALADLRQPLSNWLSPIVIETDGTLAPFTYGLPRHFALGNLNNASLRDLIQRWDPTPVVELTSRTLARLRQEDQPLFDWYSEIHRSATTVAHDTSADRAQCAG